MDDDREHVCCVWELARPERGHRDEYPEPDAKYVCESCGKPMPKLPFLTPCKECGKVLKESELATHACAAGEPAL
jgi:predicted amidophosphoribosyltransferase